MPGEGRFFDELAVGNVVAEGFIDVAKTEYQAAASIAADDIPTFIGLNNASAAVALTIAAPKPGRLVVIAQLDSGTQGHTVTLTAGTYDGTNDVATLNAEGEALVLFGIADDRFIIVENIGAVALS